MAEPSSLFYIATTLSTLFGFTVPDHGTNRPSDFARTVRVEKLYAEGDKIVATPVLDLAVAGHHCPEGHMIRREGRETRDGKTFLTWDLRCR
jgi:hypothetical protein